MKQNTHPDYHEVKVTCSCGNKFVTKSSMEKENFNATRSTPEPKKS